MEKLYEPKEKLWDELAELADKREMGAGDLEVVHKITDTIKNIDKICMLEDGTAKPWTETAMAAGQATPTGANTSSGGTTAGTALAAR